MRQKKFWFAIKLVVLAVVIILPAGAVAASKYKELHRFKAGDASENGVYPEAGLIFDAAGNLYGTTVKGGSHGCGTVFKLTPNSDGSWTESVLHSFYRAAGEGCDPYSTLIFDAAGNLYGTTAIGGSGKCNPGCGTVFKLTPNSDGSWTESVLHDFTGGADGRYSYGRLTFDGAGNLYGATGEGGNLSYCQDVGCGVVFKLTPNPKGIWTESVLYTFTGGADGQGPQSDLIFDEVGDLYGTAASGGSTKCNPGCGTVFKLTPNRDGSWTESVLHSFTGGHDGYGPSVGLTLDTGGNLYGTTFYGGIVSCNGGSGCGTVFELTPNADGSWKHRVIHNFGLFLGQPARFPGGIVLDGAGNLCGTAQGGPADGGVIYKLTTNSDQRWRYTSLHIFLGQPAVIPNGNLVFDKAGSVYGTTHDCGRGTGCHGVVFEITP